MLGKHVNVSAKNRKFIHKVLCVILAIVLIGLMVPHGLAAQLSAYAGNEAEQTPAAETQADNSQESTPAEEVNTPEAQTPVAAPVPSNEGEPTNEDTTVDVTVSFGNGMTLADDTTVPEHWQAVHQDPSGDIVGLEYTNTFTEGSELPKYKDIIDDLDIYVEGGTAHDKITGIPEGTSLFTFAYVIGQNIDLDADVQTGNYNAEAELVTSITINVDDSMTEHNPKLLYSHAGKTRETYDTWPTSKQVTFLKYNSDYSIDPTTGFLHDAIVVDTHVAYSNFSAWCELDSPYQFTRFSTNDTGKKIVPGLTFTANFVKEVTMTFSCVDYSMEAIDGAKLYNGGTEVTGSVNIPEGSFYVLNASDKTLEFYDAQTGGSLLRSYHYVIEGSYELEEWQYYVADDDDYTTIGTTRTQFNPASGDAFRAIYKQTTTAHLVSYPAISSVPGVKFYHVVDAEFTPDTWEDKVATVGGEYFTSTTTEDYVGLIEISGEIYAFKFDSPTVGQYSFDKWLVSTNGSDYEDIGDGGTVDGEIWFKAQFKENAAVTFDFNVSTSGAALQHSTDGQTWSAFTGTIYYEEGYYYKKYVDENNVINLQIGLPGEEVEFEPVDWFRIQGATTGYQFGKWTVGTTEVGTTLVSITGNVTFTANMQIELTFVIDPKLDPPAERAGHVEDSSVTEVTTVWAYPDDPITYEGNVAKIGKTGSEETYTAVVDNPAYEFGNWPTTITTVPKAPSNFTVTFKKQSDVEFNFNVLEGFEEGIQIKVSYGGAAPTVVNPGSHMYFTEGSKYWANDKGNLVIGTDTATAATQYVFTVTEGTHTHFNCWKVNDVEITTDPVELTNEDPYEAVVMMDVDARVMFNISSDASATPDNCLIKRNGTVIESFETVYYYKETTFTVNGKSLNIATSDIDSDAYFANSGEHYQKFEKWVDDKGADIVPGNLEYNKTYTFIAKFEKLDPLTQPGYFYKYVSEGEGPHLAGTAYVDIYLVDKNAEDLDVETFLRTDKIDVSASTDYEITNLPHRCKIYITGFSTGYITEDASMNFVDSADPVNPVKCKFQTNAMEFDKSGISADLKTWTSSYGKVMTLDGCSKDTDGNLVVDTSSKISVQVKDGDKINLDNNIVGAEPTLVTATFTGATCEGGQTTNFKRQAYTDRIGTGGSAYKTLVITFSGTKKITGAEIFNNQRTISFAADTAAGKGSGTFTNSESATIAPMNTTYTLTDPKNQTITINYADGSKVEVTAEPITTGEKSQQSIFRNWTNPSEQCENVPIVEDITFRVKFVKAWVGVSFEGVDATSQAVTVAIDPDASTTLIPMDSFYDPDGTNRTTLTTVNCDFMQGDAIPTVSFNLKLSKEDEAVKYKFDTVAFPDPKPAAGAEVVNVNETAFPAIETSGLPIKYKIVKKTPVKIEANLLGGMFVNGYALPEIATDKGGKGAWEESSVGSGIWTNSIYEEYEVATLKSETIESEGLTWDKVFKIDGFFKRPWLWNNTGVTEPTVATAGVDLLYKADYEDAVWIGGTVTDSNSGVNDPISKAEIRFTTDAEKGLDPSGEKTLKAFTDTDGKFTKTDSYVAKEQPGRGIQVYKGSAGELSAGCKEYIQDEMDLTSAQLQNDKSDCDFALDKGYSFFATDFSSGSWYARYYQSIEDNPHIETAGSVGKSGDEVVLGSNQTLYFDGTGKFRRDSGDEIIVSTSTQSGHFNVEVQNLLTEDVAFSSNKFLYTCWAQVNTRLRNSDGEEAKKISRIDYRMPWEDYISVYGTLTQQGTTDPLSGIKVSYNADNSNEVIEGNYSRDNGVYYIVIKTLQGDQTGTVMIEDVDGDADDHLDERVRLSSADTQDITPTHAAASTDTANKAMIPAIHVTGLVSQPMPGAEETESIPVDGAVISFQQNDSDPYTWNNDIHSPAYTGEDGTYSLKLRKDANNSGGTVWFTKDGYTDDGHLLAIENPSDPEHPTPIAHGPNDIDNINAFMTLEGANVEIVGGEGHKLFEVKYYNAGRCYMTKEMESVEEMSFAKSGVFQSVYGENGSILRYEFKAASIDDFAITLRPIADDGYTYWAWRCLDKTDGKQWTLKDQEKIGDDGKLATHEYKFTVDYAEGTEVTVGGGASAGHAGWNFDLSVESGGVAGEAIHNVIGPDDYTFTFPITQNQDPEYANVTTEEINVGYSFNDGTFSLELESAFQTDDPDADPVPYTERRAFTPIPAEGYMFTGISVNGQDLTPGTQETIDLSTGDLNVVAKYAEIPNPASTGDSTPNMWWLVGLAVLAMLGVAYGASRKQKGIRC